MTPVSNRLRNAGRWLPLVVWMTIMSLFSTDNFSSESTGSIIEPVVRIILGKSYSEQLFELVHYFIRKSAHVTEYAILGLLWFRALNPGFLGWRRKAAVMAFFLSAVYASLDEFHQTFTLNRGGNPLDVMIDSSGALMALIGIWVYNKKCKA